MSHDDKSRRLAAWADGICKTCGNETRICNCEHPKSSLAERLIARSNERTAPSSTREIDAEVYQLAKRMMGRSTRPAVYEAHELAKAVISLSEQVCASAPSASVTMDGLMRRNQALEKALIAIRDECFSGNAYDIAVAALKPEPDAWPFARRTDGGSHG